MRIYDLERGAEPKILTLPAGEEIPLRVAINRSGELAAAALSDGSVAVWRTADADHPRVLTTGMTSLFAGMKSPFVSSLEFAPKSGLLAAAIENAAFVWDLSHEEPPRIFYSAGRTNSVAWSPDESLLASGGDTAALVWDVRDGREIARLPHDHNSEAIAFSPDGKILSTADWLVRLWREPGSATDFTFRWRQTLSGTALSPAGTFVAIDVSDRLLVYRTSNGSLLKTLKHRSDGGISKVRFSADESAVALSGPGDLEAWRLDGPESTHLLFVYDPPSFDSSGHLVAGNDGKGFGVFPVGSGGVGFRCGGMFSQSGRVLHSLSPDGKTAVAADDRKLAVCDSSGTRMFDSGKFGRHVWSPDSRHLVIYAADTMKVYRSGEWKAAAEIPVKGLGSVSFRGDSRQMAVLVARGGVGLAALANPEKPQEPVRIPLDFEPLGSAYSKGGTEIAVFGQQPFAEVWNVERRERIAQVGFEEP